MLPTLNDVIRDLEPRYKSNGKLSQYLWNIIKPGQEDRFWSPEEKVTLVDTSVFIDGYFQHNIWGVELIIQMDRLGVAPVVIPEVAGEINRLNAEGRTDEYDMVVIDRDLEVDLKPGNVALNIHLDEGLEEKVLNMWKSTSVKHRNYLRSIYSSGENSGTMDRAVRPGLSRTDNKVMQYALQRAGRGLPTAVLSGDRDIVGTMNAFRHLGYPIDVYGQTPPSGNLKLNTHVDLELIITAEAIRDINASGPGYFVIFSPHEQIVGSEKRPVGFKVVDIEGRYKGFFHVPILDADALNDQRSYQFLRNHRYIAVPSENNSAPLIKKLGRLIYNTRKQSFQDPSGYYHDVDIKARLTKLGVPKKEFHGYYNSFASRRFMEMTFPAHYGRVTEGYMFSHLPQLYNRVLDLKKMF